MAGNHPAATDDRHLVHIAIVVAERGGVSDLESGKAVERVRVVWRARLRFLKNRLSAQAARGWAAMVDTSSLSGWGFCRSSGRRQQLVAGAWIRRVGGRSRNMARAITSHRFGLWLTDPEIGRPRDGLLDSGQLNSSVIRLLRSAQDLRGVSPIRDRYRRHTELEPRKDIQFADFPVGSRGQLASCTNHRESSSLAFPDP